jgi:hypothetical protein
MVRNGRPRSCARATAFDGLAEVMRTWSAITLEDAFLRHELSVTVLLGSFDVGGVCSGLGGDPRGLLALPVGPVTVARLLALHGRQDLRTARPSGSTPTENCIGSG